jgi:RNA polymerase sigma factor (sigma-70 family)
MLGWVHDSRQGEKGSHLVISTVDSPISPSLTTRELLEQFERTGSPAPFEELMRRYGAMVFNVCFKVTRDKHDAEDAMQATFLTLAVRARQTRKIEYLGPWLQKVGHRVALDISRSKRRRAAREQRHGELERLRQADAPQLRREGASQGVLLDELKQALREELDKLPAKYRLPLILHYFGGLRPEDVAREMKLNASTLGVRLHRGRKLLADAMSSRGFALSSAAVATMLGTLVRESVIAGMVSTSSYAAAQVAAGATVPVGVAPDVFALASAATRGLAFSRFKALAIVTVLLGGGVTGGASVAYRYLPEMDLRWRDLLRWIKPADRSTPLVPTVDVPRIRLSETTPSVPDTRPLVALPPMIENEPPSLSASPAEHVSIAATPVAAQFDLELPRASAAPVPAASAASSPAFVAPAKPGPTVHSPVRAFAFEKKPAQSATGSATASSPKSLDVASTFWHRSGSLRLDSLRIDSNDVPAKLHLTGGEVIARQMVVGDRGHGSFRQTGGTLRIDEELIVALKPESSGSISLSGGSLAAGTLAVGMSDDGSFEQTGGDVLISKVPVSANADRVVEPMSPGTLALGVEPSGRGEYTLRDGTLSAQRLLVGVAGHGTYRQTGGRAQFDAVTLGVAETGNGIVQLAGGDLRVRSRDLDGRSLESAVVIGRAGAAVLQLGGDRDAFQLVERLPDSRVPLVVRATGDGDGVIHGWGKVTLTGPFVQNGRVIADGFGQSRLLDFSSMEFVANTIDNAPGAANGWFARDGGALRLPPLRVFGDGDYTWGESPTDPQLDLVNSLRLTLHNVTVGGSLLVTLRSGGEYAPRELPASSLLALWELDGDDVRFGSADLTVRYDDIQLAMLGQDATQLSLYGFDGSWQRIDPARLAVDVEHSLLLASLDRPYERLALTTTTLDDSGDPTVAQSVSRELATVGSADPVLTIIPEPTGAAIVLLGSAGAMLRRRRTSWPPAPDRS